MQKTRKIILALTISLVILLIINFVFITKTNSNYIELPIFNSNILKDSTISQKNISYIKVKKESLKEEYLENILGDIDFKNCVLKQDVHKGELVTKNVMVSKDKENIEDKIYVVLPVSIESSVTCNKLTFGDTITVFYTAKLKDVSNAINGKEKIHATETQEGFVTCKLLEEVQFVSKYDATANEIKDGVVASILIRVKSEDAMLISNLKQTGTFDIVIL